MQCRSEYILRDFPNSSSFAIRDSRLNKLFKTDKFQVMKFTKGEVIVENNGEQGMV